MSGMNRIYLAVAAGALAGALTGYVSGPDTISAQTAPTQNQPQASGRGGPGVPDIPPVPNPPLYPDREPTKAMHWSWEDIRKIAEARLAGAGRGGRGQAAGLPAFQGQNFRTHYFGGMALRQKHDPPVPSNHLGVMSPWDDVDQHEGVTDFYIHLGGRGQYIVDGETLNREYTRRRGNSGNSSYLMMGELHGQPLRNGRAYDGQVGDWLNIPPGVPHGWLPEPGIGMLYLLFKVNIGYYPPALIG